MSITKSQPSLISLYSSSPKSVEMFRGSSQISSEQWKLVAPRFTRDKMSEGYWNVSGRFPKPS